MNTENLYTYKAVVEKVIDGDTVKLSIDLGFKMRWRCNCRLAGINAAELRSSIDEERVAARKAREHVANTLAIGTNVLIKSQKLDKYGRPIVQLYYGDGFTNSLNEEMLSKGFAVEYM